MTDLTNDTQDAAANYSAGYSSRSADEYEVVIIGGGPAGLAAGLMLGRSRRSVLVVDDGRPRNKPAAAVHGYLSRDGMSPAELLSVGRDEVRHYGGQILAGRATSVRVDGPGFAVEVEVQGDPSASAPGAATRTVRARKLMISTGLVDQLPDLPGIRERWGRDVLHCPYCHGWEVRDQQIAILGMHPLSVHQAQLFRQLSDRVTYLSHDAPPLDVDQLEQLDARGITVVDQRVEALEIVDDTLVGVRTTGGELISCDALVIGAPIVVNSALLTGLGIETEQHPSGFGDFVPADEVGRTSVPGVYVAGNVNVIQGQVSTAASAGSMTGAMINAELIQAEVAAAVQAARGPAHELDGVSSR